MEDNKKQAKVRLMDSPRTELDQIESKKVRGLLDQRRATGMPNFKDMMRFSVDDDDDDNDDENDENVEGTKGTSIRHSGGSAMKYTGRLSMARYMVRLSVIRRLSSNDPNDKPCPHSADEWCVCPNRFHGYNSTFVDKDQPPYTVWHAGTDHVQLEVQENGKVVPENLIPVEVFNMTGEDGFVVQICNYGAQVTSILMPDHNGLIEEVMPFFPNMIHAQNNANLYMSGLYGRVGACVNNGSMKGTGFDIQLELNENDKHHLNGGIEAGFDRLPWQAAVAGEELVFTLLLPDGAGGYPGALLLTARYCVRPRNTLALRLSATCTRPCPLLPALRIPLNLAGHGSGKSGMLEHVLTINASQYYVTNKKNYTPTGEQRRVGGSIYDLRTPRGLSAMHPRAPWPGYRVYYHLDDEPTLPSQLDGARTGEGDEEDDENAPLPFAAKLFHPQSRRTVELRTNQPTLYFETAHMTLPTDPEDVDEEVRREQAERKREREKIARKNAAKAAKNKAVQKEEYGEEEEEYREELPKEKPKVKVGGLAFDDDVTEYKFEQEKPVFGRGGFLYNRCGAITLQPQKEPLFEPKKKRGGREEPVDGSRQLLEPGRRLLYAATYRFYLQPKSEWPRRPRARRTRDAKAAERLGEARAKFDECDIDISIPQPREKTPPPEAPPPVPEDKSRVSFKQGDLQADRCSVESIFQDKSRYDRVFLGPPTDPVPPPKRRKCSAIPGIPESDLDSSIGIASILSYAFDPNTPFQSYTNFIQHMGKLFLMAFEDDFAHTPQGYNGLDFIQDPFRPAIAPRLMQQLRHNGEATPCSTPIGIASALENIPGDHRLSLLEHISEKQLPPENENDSIMYGISRELIESIHERVHIIKSLSGEGQISSNDEEILKQDQNGTDENEDVTEEVEKLPRSPLHHSLSVRGNSLDTTVVPPKRESQNRYSNLDGDNIFGYDIEPGEKTFNLL